MSFSAQPTIEHEGPHPQPLLATRSQPDTTSLQGSVDGRRRRANLCGCPSKRQTGLIQANGLIGLGLAKALATHRHASGFEDLQDTAFTKEVLRAELSSGNTVQVVPDECLADVIREPEVRSSGKRGLPLLLPISKLAANKHKIELFALAADIIQPLITLPQIITIYANQRANDVSLLTWLGYLFFGITFLSYGIAFKLKLM